MSKPERQAIADNRSDGRCDKEEPRLDFSGGRQSTDRHYQRGTRHHRTYYGDGFRQREEEHRGKGEVRMCSDEINQRVKIGHG
jgi:hypothetical protein